MKSTASNHYKQEHRKPGINGWVQSDTGGADTRYNPHTGNNETLIIYQREVVLRVNKEHIKRHNPPKRKPKDIQRFSKKSRLRMLRKFNRLQTAQLNDPLFITLTARNYVLTPEEFRNRFLKTFLPKLKVIIPELVFCWRLEFHESGFPHIHMFAWSFQKHRNLHSQFYKRPIRKAWRESIYDDSRAAELHSCKIKEIGSFRKAIFYVAKYTAKEDQHDNSLLTGRRWAMSKNFPASPITEIPLTRDQSRLIREIAKAVQRKRVEQGAKPFEITGDETEIFIWLNPDQIYGIILTLNRLSEAGLYKRVVNKGSPDFSDDELSALANEFGHQF